MILVVDDNAAFRAMVMEIVRQARPEEILVECAGGHEAVQAYFRLRPSIVLMDIRMDGMDGLTAMKTIRSSDPGARIVMVTHFDDLELREEARQSGAEGFVSKEHLDQLRAFLA